MNCLNILRGFRNHGGDVLAHNEGKAVVFEAGAEDEALAVQTKLQQAGLTTEMQRVED